MMAARDEAAAVERATTLAAARRLCSEWAYWALRTNIRTGYEPFMSTGGIERYYRAPWQWDTPPPRMPEANEISGLAVQRAFIRLPDRPYRSILRAEFCVRPFIVPLKEGELEAFIARRARVSQGAYNLTLERALLALANVMKRQGSWRRD
jgi:hypothetical protein